ncbi:MAG TPA: hypothetical protein VN836_06270 [Verrucomicrobiae bacterium]|nr:hypothetical protein [Verrucomicrobiae bacterium]
MRASLPFKMFLVTIAAVVTGYYLVVSVSVGGLMPYDYTAADVIRSSCPFHLVPATWVSGSNEADLLVRWSFAETKARLAMLLALWILTMCLSVWLHLRRRRCDP